MTAESKPLTGIIVDSTAAFSTIRRLLLAVRDADVWLISAYLKSNALRALTSGMHDSNRVSVLCRWAPMDLVSGSSDLESYNFARSCGWKFFVREDLHAKAYRIGEEAILLGSGNLTNKGFGLNQAGNLETMVSVTACQENIASLSRIFDRSVEVDQGLFLKIESWLARQPKEDAPSNIDGLEESPLARVWREQLARPSCIAVSECFYTDGNWLDSALAGTVNSLGDDELHDLSLLECNNPAGKLQLRAEDISDRVRRTRLMAWLRLTVQETSGREIYFGALTAAFHSTLLDDPKPCRKDVKTLLSNALAWAARFPESGVYVDRPAYSQRIFLP